MLAAMLAARAAAGGFFPSPQRRRRRGRRGRSRDAMKISAGVEYYGSQYAGRQRQQHSAAGQGRVEAALAAVADHLARATGAGKTDAGVQALGRAGFFPPRNGGAAAAAAAAPVHGAP